MSVVAYQYDSIYDLAQTIVQRVGIPKDRWEIAAQLEVLGYRDADVRELYGFRDVFEAADRIIDLFQQGEIPFRVEGEDPVPHVNPVLHFLKRYADGLMFSLPMLLQGATMLLWGYGLWGAIDIEVRVGSSIALGFIASYIVTAGFSWATVSRGLFYYYQKEGALARWSALRIWTLGIRTALLLALPALVFNLLYRLLPLDMFFIALAYYVALSVFWLNWSLIYLGRKTHWLLLILLGSIMVVVLLSRVMGWPVIASHMTGFLIADGLTFAVGLKALNKMGRNGNGESAPINPPRLTVLFYATAQVFLYGVLYSTFLFTDRILAWTAIRGREDFPPYPFWLNSRYELGMDLSLLVVAVLAGIVEFSAYEFSVRLVPYQKRVKSASIEPFITRFRQFSRRHAIGLALSAIVAIALAGAAFYALTFYPEPRLQASLTSSTTLSVFIIAAISYAILMMAMQKILMLMILSRASLAVRDMTTALVVNAVAGFTFSRAVHYSGAVVGLLAGSIVLAWLAYRDVRDALAELDYHYYAAF